MSIYLNMVKLFVFFGFDEDKSWLFYWLNGMIFLVMLEVSCI